MESMEKEKHVNRIIETLKEQSDSQYADFQRRLIPTVDGSRVIGVRTPVLRTMAKTLTKTGEADELLLQLPHDYFEENQLHAFVLSGMKDFDKCVEEVERFLPYIDNWATCDQLSPKVFRKHLAELLPHINRWTAAEHEYTVRFGIKMLMEHYLDDAFAPRYPETVAGIHRDEYYIKMMQAWYFATALAKQYDAILPFLQENRLEEWTLQKTIQKAIESYRINDEQKAELRKLRRKG